MKTDSIARAQAGHRLASAFSPEDLYAFTMALASAWMEASPYAPAALSKDQLGARRAAVVEAVRRLTTPKHDASRAHLERRGENS
jgi:hypothetical protein